MNKVNAVNADSPERIWIGRASLEIAQRNGSSDFYVQKTDGLIDVEYVRADTAIPRSTVVKLLKDAASISASPHTANVLKELVEELEAADKTTELK